MYGWLNLTFGWESGLRFNYSAPYLTIHTFFLLKLLILLKPKSQFNPYVCPFFHMSICWSVHQSLHSAVCLFVSQSIFLSACSSVCPSICPFGYLSVYSSFLQQCAGINQSLNWGGITNKLLQVHLMILNLSE